MNWLKKKTDYNTKVNEIEKYHKYIIIVYYRHK